MERENKGQDNKWDGKKMKEKKGYALSDGSRHHSDIIRHHTRTDIIVAASSNLSLTFR